jgi:hypothetical protein
MKYLWGLHWALLFILLTATAQPAGAATYVVPPCTGDPLKDTPILETAFARNGLILFPPCEYVVSRTLRLRSGTQLIGAGYPNTAIKALQGNGTPLIDSDPATSLTGVYVADINFKGRFGNGVIGTGDAFLLHAVTDASFERVRVSNFRGNGFTIRKRTGSTDPTSLRAVKFNSVFVLSVGGYAFDIDGRVDATWTMLDINSPSTGAFRFRAGYTSNSFIGITGFIAEWHKSYASKNHMLYFDNPNGQAINLAACSASTFGGFENLAFIRALGTVRVNFTGCTGGNGTTLFKYWLVSPSRNVPYSARINASF